MSPADHFICLERKYPAPVQLQVNREIRSDSFKIHGYSELKYVLDVGGVIFKPEVDILYLDPTYAMDISPKWLQVAARQSQALDKIRSIAISLDHKDLPGFIDSLKNYSSLELVLFVIGSGLHRRLWGVADEARISEKNEIMFELIDGNAPLEEIFEIP